jgi:hypothetical protein
VMVDSTAAVDSIAVAAAGSTAAADSIAVAAAVGSTAAVYLAMDHHIADKMMIDHSRPDPESAPGLYCKNMFRRRRSPPVDRNNIHFPECKSFALELL